MPTRLVFNQYNLSIMNSNHTIWSWLFGGLSFGKMRIWPWRAEFWRVRIPGRKADIEA